MLTPRITNAVENTTISVLLQRIDDALAAMANELYYNVIYSLHKQFQGEVMQDLLYYKRILVYKSCNSNYASEFTVDQVAGRVIVLTSSVTAKPLLKCTLSGTAIQYY